MTAAHWGEIVVSDDTLRAAGDRFDARRLRPLSVKGKAALVRASRLVGEVSVTPDKSDPEQFVGRESELDKLMRLAVSRRRKRPAWAYVSGEAGIGKSRLLRELESHLIGQRWDVLTGQSHAHTSHVPFGAWNSILRSLFRVQPGDDLDRFEQAVKRLAPAHAANAALLGRMLSIRSSDGDGAEGDPAGVRQRIKDTIAAALRATSEIRPTLLIFEDAHWMDAQSLDLLSDLIGRAEGPLAIVVSSRDARPSPELKGSANVTLHLKPLSLEAARRFVTSEGDLDQSHVDSVLERSAGNPLLLGAFARSSSQGGLPETVEDAITSRVDVLSTPVKTAVRIAAVAGPTFDEEVVSYLLPPGSQPVSESLKELVESGIARVDGAGSYSFSHSVIREVVYEMLPYAQRRRMHGQVAQYIEMAQAGRLEAVSEDLLHHSERAEDIARTVRYACMSGDRAARIYAGDAAVNYYQRALGALAVAAPAARLDLSILLERTGDSLEVMGRHRDAATMYADSLHEWESAGSARARFIAGAHSEAARAAELCRKTGVSMERGSEFEESLRWLDRALEALPPGKPRLGAQICAARSVSLFRFGRYNEGVEWGQKALRMARRSRDRRQIAYSHNMLATSFMERGELRKAVRHLRQSVRIYHEIADFLGQASANNNLGMCYHLQGALDAALYYYQVALQTDQRVGDVVDAMIVRSNIGEVLMTLGRLPEAIDNLSEVVFANTGQGGLIGVAGLAHVNLSRCYLASGDTKAASRHCRLGKGLLRQAGQAGLVAEAELQRAEVLLADGRPDLAATAARTGLRQARELGARLLEARGQRVLGDALAARGRQVEAAERIRDSVSIARRIEATHEEALSLVSLARLSMGAGRNRARVITHLRRAERILGRMGARIEAAEAKRMLEEALA